MFQTLCHDGDVRVEGWPRSRLKRGPGEVKDSGPPLSCNVIVQRESRRREAACGIKQISGKPRTMGRGGLCKPFYASFENDEMSGKET